MRIRLTLILPLLVLSMACARNRGREERPAIEFLGSPVLEGMDLPFSGATRVGDFIFVSGNIGNMPGGLQLAGEDIESQTRQTLENIKAVLERHGSSMDRVVKVTVMMADMNEWGAMNEVYREYFKAPYPARSAFGASGLAAGARLEIECIAVAR